MKKNSKNKKKIVHIPLLFSNNIHIYQKCDQGRTEKPGTMHTRFIFEGFYDTRSLNSETRRVGPSILRQY